jgi:hypothetical protein
MAKSYEALEAEIAQLKARLDKVDPPKPITAAPPPQEEGVRTYFPRVRPIEMPTSKQFEKLFAIVARARPKDVPEFSGDWDRSAFISRSAVAFEYLTTVRRTEVINKKFYIGGFVDRANIWLSAQGSAVVEGSHFMAAVYMAGDIPYQLPNPAEGIVFGLGLTFDPSQTPASSAGWKGVLERGALRPPTVPVIKPQSNRVASVVQYQ